MNVGTSAIVVVEEESWHNRRLASVELMPAPSLPRGDDGLCCNVGKDHTTGNLLFRKILNVQSSCIVPIVFLLIYILILILSSPYIGGDTTPWLEPRPCSCGLLVTGNARRLKTIFSLLVLNYP